MEINYDFNGSLRLTEVVEDFFFSRSTGLFVYRHPLSVDERVLNIANDLGIKVQASPEKWLVNATLSDSLRILEGLGSAGMSLPEFFRIRKDAMDAGDEDMVSSLESDQFIEMLSTIFLYDREMIHHPRTEGALVFSGDKIPVHTPRGRYGWFNPGEVDPETGLPMEVKFARNIDDETFKYWDTHTDIGRDGLLMAVRGFVTSVGKISLDLGFPADAVSHRLSIREVRRAKPEGALDEETLDEAKALLFNYYRDLEDKTMYEKIPVWHCDLLSFINRRILILHSARDVASQVLKEDIYDVLGILWSLALKGNDASLAGKIMETALSLSSLMPDSISDESFSTFVLNRKDKIKEAVRNQKSIVFVMGHNNPDTDTVVSALAESYRQHLLHKDESVFIPVVPGAVLPEEIHELLGDEFSGCLIFSEDKEYRTASTTGRPEWIMVDHNIGPQQPDTRAIIDHHYPSDVCLKQKIPRRIIYAGSTTALVALKIYGAGLTIPRKLAKILQGAALMDTEDRFIGKMTPLDELVMDRLKDASSVDNESVFYQGLMKKLISCYNPEELFIRDYKEDWSFFGFAVAKGIKLLSKENSNIIERLAEHSGANNNSKNLPLTILKIVDYDDDAETIRKERVYPVFIKNSSDDFREAVSNAIVTVIRHESGKDVHIKTEKGYIEYRGVGTQLSRKKLAPVLELVVNAFNRYFYSPSTSMFFKRDFLKKDKKLEEVSNKFKITYHSNEEGIVVGNPAQLKFLLQKLGLICASPAEYFKAYFDALKVNDKRMVSHLTSARYLETLDAIIEDKQVLVEHPEIIPEGGGFSYDKVNRKKVNVPKGEPGLIDPKKIDPDTGLPTEVHDPRQYGTGLWRYWSPDSDCAWVLRSTIFAYDMPALDLKFHFDEVLPRLTIRPCVNEVIHPKVDIYEKDNRIMVDITD